ncbi:MAG: c-type cytochrome [Gammaproteobacteria bacterium]|nr:c-type cytochrome [Gammaproteobacteria bacterium]
MDTNNIFNGRARCRRRLRLLLMMLCIPAASWGADAENGERLAFQYHCMTCHGEHGRSNAGRYPHLAGQHAAYLEARLNYFRSAVEPGNMMNAQAAHLEDAEIADLAAYFSRQAR